MKQKDRERCTSSARKWEVKGEKRIERWVNREDQVQAQAHHPLETISKGEHTVVVFSCFATTWKGKRKGAQELQAQVIRWWQRKQWWY